MAIIDAVTEKTIFAFVIPCWLRAVRSVSYEVDVEVEVGLPITVWMEAAG